MSRCPSQDWDRYCDLLDDDTSTCFQCRKVLPEDDPDPENEGASPWWDGFCSEKCRAETTK